MLQHTKTIFSSLWRHFAEVPFLFQHGCLPVHKSRTIKTWFDELGVRELDRPAQSPDLNSTGQLCHRLERRLRGGPSRPTSVRDLNKWSAEWMDPDFHRNTPNSGRNPSKKILSCYNYRKTAPNESICIWKQDYLHPCEYHGLWYYSTPCLYSVHFMTFLDLCGPHQSHMVVFSLFFLQLFSYFPFNIKALSVWFSWQCFFIALRAILMWIHNHTTKQSRWWRRVE